MPIMFFGSKRSIWREVNIIQSNPGARSRATWYRSIAYERTSSKREFSSFQAPTTGVPSLSSQLSSLLSGLELVTIPLLASTRTWNVMLIVKVLGAFRELFPSLLEMGEARKMGLPCHSPSGDGTLF